MRTIIKMSTQLKTQYLGQVEKTPLDEFQTFALRRVMYYSTRNWEIDFPYKQFGMTIKPLALSTV